MTIPGEVNLSAFADRRLPVNATFVAPTTNLVPSNASGVVAILTTDPEEVTVTTASYPDESSGLFGLGIPWWAWLAVVVLIAGIGTYLGLVRPTERGGVADDGDRSRDESGGEAGAGIGPEPGTEQDVPPSLLAFASERLAAGMADTATEAGYEAVRRRLTERLGVTAGTHWELYRACQVAEWPENRIEAIRQLTEAYEQAAFAPGSLSVEAARKILDEGDVASGGD